MACTEHNRPHPCRSLQSHSGSAHTHSIPLLRHKTRITQVVSPLSHSAAFTSRTLVTNQWAGLVTTARNPTPDRTLDAVQGQRASGKGSPPTAAQGHTPHKHQSSIEVLATLPGVRGGVRAWRVCPRGREGGACSTCGWSRRARVQFFVFAPRARPCSVIHAPQQCGRACARDRWLGRAQCGPLAHPRQCAWQ